MKKLYIRIAELLLLPLLSLFYGCENQPTELEDFVQEPQLNAYIYNSEPVSEVYFHWTVQFGSFYDLNASAISNADIRIFPEDIPISDTAGTVLYLAEDSSLPGHYITPIGVNWLPQGMCKYRIVAQKSMENIYITAVTMVPDTFQILVWHPILVPDSMEFLPEPPDTLVFPDTLTREAPPIFLLWTEADSGYGYISNVISLVPPDSLIPLDPDFEIGVDSVEEQEQWGFNLQFMTGDQFQQTMAWMNFNWVGSYRVDMMAISEDYYEYVYGGMRLMQGLEIDVPSNIQGGEGIFGGLCRRSFKLTLKRIDG
jgi:hypothetical protein